MAAKARALSQPPSSWDVYKKLPGIVLGFHGCDLEVGEAVLKGKTRHLKPSSNPYDWLGDGIYFWEDNPWRAYEFAAEAAKKNPRVTRGTIRTPFVVGAVIDLAHCCNLLDSSVLRELRVAYDMLKIASDGASIPLPRNRGSDMGARFLDKAVIDSLHTVRRQGNLAPYDTVRAAFVEGERLYEQAGFHAKNHIQIAVRNPSCIKGYFRLPDL